MKKVLFILLFLTTSAASFAQQDTVSNNETELVSTTVEKVEAKKVSISAEVKATVIKLNHKKSNEIISIKAYRKSLQLKMKTIKLC
ncbi:hypothetical protein [Winogradskyella sp. SYSU M77433]|uniref:hypothetical protein n=1 Tax=Winogradskyella sp. SYSU M77433 TaxID=3042722 RepID=UPI0024815520|nr:hypothetical protein [Winogradskyella sp. SYSU M77433]MDH7913345.1 hypothetical protein [Winogradskyella sp. SYSU M77433]|tara:strand:- start:281 stop:538 length:258 start_codon:yes stop_codon:yes gene_type:complete